VDLHFKSATEHAFLKAGNPVEEEAKDGNPAQNHPVQSTEVGPPGVTGHVVQRLVEQAIKYKPGHVPTLFHSMAERTVRDNCSKVETARRRNTVLLTEAGAIGVTGQAAV